MKPSHRCFVASERPFPRRLAFCSLSRHRSKATHNSPRVSCNQFSVNSGKSLLLGMKFEIGLKNRLLMPRKGSCPVQGRAKRNFAALSNRLCNHKKLPTSAMLSWEQISEIDPKMPARRAESHPHNNRRQSEFSQELPALLEQQACFCEF